MVEVLVYRTGWCPFCTAALALLADKGVTPVQIDIDREPGRRSEMQQRSGRHTVPQIFIGEYHVGGFDDLLALERAGDLERLLSAPARPQGEPGS
ncbi:MAG: glutaredoxin 3 [Chromatiales bacterium]|nr:glutaredoxin 3 [Chromatiales bacterium]